MRITKIKVNNFKSLVDFEIDLAQFNCLIGLNGSGKSTFLQFMDFLSQLMKGNVNTWLTRRKWRSSDIFNNVNKAKRIQFEIVIVDDNNKSYSWKASYSQKSGCRNECLIAGDRQFCTCRSTERNCRSWRYTADNGEITKDINFKYNGSIFSTLEDKDVPNEFYKLRDFISGINSCDLLAPHFLRQKTRESEGSIGLEGKDLASFLYELGKGKRKIITERLQNVYPQIESIDVKSLRSGWKQLFIKERYQEKQSSSTESQQICDGLLRMIAFLAQLEAKQNVLCFDEIENGINPELISFLIEEFVNAKQQIFVTTHSPLLLNYLDDNLARKSVHYFYKTQEGYTHCVPFFEIPSIKQKLGILGPGEVFADTDLPRLSNEIEQMTTSAGKEK